MMLGEDLSFEVNRCISCGACNIVCPLFIVTGFQETAGPRARLRLLSMVNTGALEFSVEFLEYLYDCMSCGKCNEACPVELKISDLIVKVREFFIGQGYVPPFNIVQLPRKVKDSNSFFGDSQAKGVWLPPDFKPEKASILYYAGCWAQEYPEIPLSSFELIKRVEGNVTTLGYEEPCSGRILEMAGYSDVVEEIRPRLVERVREVSPEKVVSSCSVSVRAFKFMGLEATSLSNFLLEALRSGKIKLKQPIRLRKHKVSVIPSCQSEWEAKEIVEMVEGENFTELPDWACCDCGAVLSSLLDGSSFNKWAERVLKEAKERQVNVLVVEEPSCFGLITKYINENKVKGIKIIPLSQFILNRT